MSGVVDPIADAPETAWVDSPSGSVTLARPGNTPILATRLSDGTIIGDVSVSTRDAPG